MNKAIFSPNFNLACTDYHFLLNKGYPGRGSLKLVADHYQLSGMQRVVLYRGVFSDKISCNRSKRIISGYNGEKLAIDFFNALFTVANYLYGRTLFLATDGLLKDNGACFVQPRPGALLSKAMELLIEFLAVLTPPGCDIYLDQDFTHCSVVVAELENRLTGLSFPWKIMPVKNPDQILKSVAAGLLVTTDSVVLDKSSCSIFDLAHQVVAINFHPLLPDLRKITETIA